MSRRLLSYFTPNNLSGLIAWLKADALALADADPVASWTDSSGNSNTPTQATGAAKPTFKTGILGGKAIIRFDGGDSLAMPTEGNFDLATPTIIAVFKRTSGTGGSIISKNTTGFTDNRRRKIQLNTSAGGIGYSSGSDGQGIAITATPSNWNMVGVVARADNNHSMFLNGSQSDFATALGDSGLNNASVLIGCAFGTGVEGFTGDIAEIIVYNRPLSLSEMVGLQNYLIAKYKLIGYDLALGGVPRSHLTNERVLASGRRFVGSGIAQ